MAYSSDKSKRKRRNKRVKSDLFGFLMGIALIVGFVGAVMLREYAEKRRPVTVLGDGQAYFHFLDVGQGDATLITSGDGAVVIDTGGVDMGQKVGEYIRTYTESVDYMILTHPHEDHMGCASEVLNTVEVKNVILPDVASDGAFFLRFLEMAEALEVNVMEAVPGDVYTVGEMTLTILAPLDTSDENLNNVSVVTRVDVGDTSALFTGDAESEVEELLLERYAAELRCDLYQAGHHGSSTSSTHSFMETVRPKVAVISCGKWNTYGHPHRETLATFASLGVEVYRTDEDGDMIFVSDGGDIMPYPRGE